MKPSTTRHPKPPLPTLVWATAWVSFFADVSTELIYGILPAYYLGTLSISIVAIGLIEGFAETIVSLTKLFSGTLSDRTGHRNRWMLAGYSLATAAKPFLVLVKTAPALAALRAADRFGKGIRGAPRDALLSRAVTSDQRGRAFGINRALDHAGALAGGLIAAALLATTLVTPKELILASVIPGAISVLIIAIFIHDRPSHPSLPSGEGEAEGRASTDKRSTKPPFSPTAAWHSATPALKRYLIPAGIFALANSSDILLLALAYERFRAEGVAEHAALGSLPLLWAILHVVKSAATPWGGTLSDRRGRIPTIRIALIVYAVTYAAGATIAAGWVPTYLLWPLFALYGFFSVLAEAPERALVADLQTDPTARGSAFGLLHFVQGLLVLPATALAAGLWQTVGSAYAFATGAALAIVALIVLSVLFSGRGLLDVPSAEPTSPSVE